MKMENTILYGMPATSHARASLYTFFIQSDIYIFGIFFVT